MPSLVAKCKIIIFAELRVIPHRYSNANPLNL